MHSIHKWHISPNLSHCKTHLQQEGDDLGVAEGAGVVQGDEAAVVAGADVAAGLQEVLDGLAAAVPGGEVQRRAAPARRVARVDVLRADQLAHLGHVAALARLEELAQRVRRRHAQRRQQQRGARRQRGRGGGPCVGDYCSVLRKLVMPDCSTGVGKCKIHGQNRCFATKFVPEAPEMSEGGGGDIIAANGTASGWGPWTWG